MNLFCPICQSLDLLNDVPEYNTVDGLIINKYCFQCLSSKGITSAAPNPYFSCDIKNHSEIVKYTINIELNGILYGFDSVPKLNRTDLLIYDYENNEFVPMTHINVFIPLPKNKEAIEQNIQRLLNLKAFF